VLDEADLLRAQLWSLLGRVLARAPEPALLQQIAGLQGDTSPLGQAFLALAEKAQAADPVRLEREYHHLFIGVARGELLPYASYYLTGFLNEKPLAKLRGDMAALGIARAEGLKDPEDHIASLCEMMAGLIAGDFRVDLAGQQRFFDRHLAGWADRFFGDLQQATAADFYRPVGMLGRTWMEIEAQAFRLAA